MTTKKVVIVTGASSGIGEATSRMLINGGAKVMLVARREDKLKKIAEELGEDEKFEDDPRAEKEIQYGRVTKRETTLSNNATLIERNFHV